MLCKILNVNLGRGLGTQDVLHVPQPVGEMGQDFSCRDPRGLVWPHTLFCLEGGLHHCAALACYGACFQLHPQAATP